ncbi:hypothetical protein [Labilibacter marinus]|uniref:hypothetical protein n=1 Tax=Labilibacter marinus TaxID=1477105 RepID=UPI00082C2233|nr:hypothetical protein [Labilibacter marinus]
MEGWIKLHRSLLEHWLYNDNQPFSKREAWIHLLLIANHSSKEIVIGNQVFLCERGQSIRSLNSYAYTFKWSKSKVSRFFKMLENRHMIETQSIHKSTRITICNYEHYQGERNASETQRIKKRNASETRAVPNKNVKNEKEEKKLTSNDNFLNNTKSKKDPFYVEL